MTDTVTGALVSDLDRAILDAVNAHDIGIDGEVSRHDRRTLIDAVLPVIAAERRAAFRDAKRRYPDGCAWCCATVPPEQRGDMHKRTCQPPPTGAPDA